MVVVVDANGRLCLMQRPPTGLLANLLEFPSVELPVVQDEGDEGAAAKLTKKFVEKNLSENFHIDGVDLKDHGEVVHQVCCSMIDEYFILKAIYLRSLRSI